MSPSQAMSVAGTGSAAHVPTSTSSERKGSSVGALTGNAPLIGVVDEGSVSGAALRGSSYSCSLPAVPARSPVRRHAPTPANKKQVTNLRWGLAWGLRSGLDSELKKIVPNTRRVLAEGSPLDEALALFTTR